MIKTEIHRDLSLVSEFKCVSNQVKEYLFESLLVRIYHYRHSPVYVEDHLKPLLFNLKLHDVCYLIARTPQVEHVFLYLKLVVLKSGNVKGVFDYAL